MSSPAELRRHARDIWDTAVAAADPRAVVRAFLAAASREIRPARRICVLGGGKAGVAMASAVEEALSDRLDAVFGVINIPGGVSQSLERITAREARPAGSNHPTVEGVRAVEEQLALADTLTPDDVALCLLSGGGSALLPAPVEGITLEDKQQVTRLLHACGATIDEMNCVRKHLSRYKGGRLAQRIAARGCPLFSLIVSDVIGDPLDVIASGPTAVDPTTFADALAVLERFDLLRRVGDNIVSYLRAGKNETLKALPSGVTNLVLANNAGSLAAAGKRAMKLGYRVVNLGSFIEGETAQAAIVHAGMVRSIRANGIPVAPPACVLSGGETTVSLGERPGKGGRNQEFVLAALMKLGEANLKNVVILSGGTDGEDGPTDAAGAIGDGETLTAARDLGLKPRVSLENHDAYTFFDAVGGLIRTGLTGTNVMDVRVVLVGG